MKRPAALFFAVIVLIITAPRLPAPISEESATPAPERSAKPKPKRTIKSTASSEGSEPSTKRQTSSPKPQIRGTPNPTPFVGTWSGTMKISFFGDIGYTFLIDPAQTTVKMWGTNKPSEIPQTKVDVCRASVGADGISWNWSAWRWTLKPYPDGKAALVKVTGPFQNGSAVFERRTNPP